MNGGGPNCSIPHAWTAAAVLNVIVSIFGHLVAGITRLKGFPLGAAFY
jgi:hypothetical protein